MNFKPVMMAIIIYVSVVLGMIVYTALPVYRSGKKAGESSLPVLYSQKLSQVAHLIGERQQVPEPTDLNLNDFSFGPEEPVR